MTRLCVDCVVLGLALAVSGPAVASQEPGTPASATATSPRQTAESPTAWQWLYEVPLPEPKPV